MPEPIQPVGPQNKGTKLTPQEERVQRELLNSTGRVVGNFAIGSVGGIAGIASAAAASQNDLSIIAAGLQINELQSLIQRMKENPRIAAIDIKNLILTSPAEGLTEIPVRENYSEDLKAQINLINAAIRVIKKDSEQVCQSFNKTLPQEVTNRHNITPLAFPTENAIGSRNNPFKPTALDYITKGDQPSRPDPIQNHFKNDGKVFPLTVLRGGSINKNGMPETLLLQDGMEPVLGEDGKPVVRKVYYTDPDTKQITEGIYFEVREPAGPQGRGGVNGVLAPASLYPIAIVQVSQLPQEQRAQYDQFFMTDKTTEQAINRRTFETRNGYFCTSWDNDRDYQYFRPTNSWLIGVQESNDRLPFIPKAGGNLPITDG